MLQPGTEVTLTKPCGSALARPYPKSKTPTSTVAATVPPGKYLIVALENESYGISVLKVREITRLQKITLVPQMPDFVKGVINLRGCAIQVVDLRLKFRLKAELADRTCIIIVQVTLPNQRTVLMGMIVDSVEEVVNLTAADIEPAPAFGTAVDTAYLLGMAKVKGQVKLMLEIDRIFAAETVPELSVAS